MDNGFVFAICFVSLCLFFVIIAGIATFIEYKEKKNGYEIRKLELEIELEKIRNERSDEE